jgi:hypothetical protein
MHNYNKLSVIVKPKFIIVGENHIGSYGTISEELVKSFFKLNPRIWFEGDEPSQSAQNFMRDFKLPSARAKSWEPNQILTPDEWVVQDAFSGSPESYLDYLSGTWDAKNTLQEQFVKYSHLYTSKPMYFTNARFITLTAGTPIAKELSKPALAKNVTPMILTAHREIYEKSGSKLYRIQDRFNFRRRDYIVRLCKTVGGIFLVGDDHLSLLRV